MTVTLTDGDGDQVSSAATDISTHINFLDDGPSVTAVTSGGNGGAGRGQYQIAASPPTSTPATIDTGAIAKGDDPDVCGHWLHFARGEHGRAGDADDRVWRGRSVWAERRATATSYALTVTNPVSGLQVTDGRRSTLSTSTATASVIVGVVQAGSPFAGQAAFAISISSTGVVTVEQYLSLHQDSLANTPNDPVSLATELAGGDGDGDRRRRRPGERPDRCVGPDQLCRRRPDGADADADAGCVGGA